jgi:signal peptidase II
MFGNSTLALAIISTITCFAVTVAMVLTARYKSNLLKAALICIAGGGLGNVVDRFNLGYVRDFLEFDFINFWPVFNLADAWLAVGCVLLIIFVIFFYKPKEGKLTKIKEDEVPVEAVQPITNHQSPSADL